MRISEVTLQNVQSHENTTLVFSPKVNVITGVSNSGKTAVIRGIVWVLTNRPLGGSFVRRGCKDSGVALTLVGPDDNSIIVIRDRFKEANTYAILQGVDDPEPLRFEAFGTSVPEEVLTALDIGDVNVQSQLDPHFLVMDSPGKVAQYINHLVGLDAVSLIVTAITSDIRRDEARWTDVQEDIRTVEEKLKVAERIDLDTFEEDLNKGVKLQAAHFEVQNHIVDLQHLCQELEAVQHTKFKISDVLLNRMMKACEEDKPALIHKRDSVRYLGELIEQLESVSIQAVKFPKDMGEQIALGEKNCKYVDTLKSKQHDLMYLICQIEEEEEQIEVIQKGLDAAIDLEKELSSQLTNCPTCGTKLTATAKKTLMESFK